jgi:beta-galactosidase
MRQAKLPGAIAPFAIGLIVSATLIACGGGGTAGESATSLSAVRITPAANLEAVRTVKPLMEDWRFVQDDALTDEQALASDANWAKRLPPAHLER